MFYSILSLSQIFFSLFENKDEDALLANYQKATPSWMWYKSGTLIDSSTNNIYRCLFPLNRLSADAIDACLSERQKLSKLYVKNNQFKYRNTDNEIIFPNDEVLVATVLTYQGKSIASIGDILKNVFSDFDPFYWKTKPAQRTNKIIHPVRKTKELAQRVTPEIIASLKERNCLYKIRPEIEDVDEVIDYILQDIKKYIKEKLEIGTLIFKLKTHLEDYIYSIYPELSKNITVWVWNNNTVVIDFKYNQIVYVMDFEFFNDKINCIAFIRNEDLEIRFEDHNSIKPMSIKKGNKKGYQIYSIPCNDISHICQTSNEVVRFYFKHLLQEVKIK